MIEAALLLGAYLVGAIPFGVIVARRRGVDLFQVGSGNVGATNVNRALGAQAALAVFLLDVLKGFGPAVAGRIWLESADWALAIGASAILGHCLSPFLGFRGGKGIATGLGVLFGSSPIVAASAFGVFALALSISRYVSLSSILAVLSTIPVGFLLGDSMVALAAYGALLIFVIYRHRANIRRLREGTEPKFRWNRRKGQDSERDKSNRKEMSSGRDPTPPSAIPVRTEGGPRA